MTGMQQFKVSTTQIPNLLGIQQQRPLFLAGLRRRINGLPAKVIPSFWQGFFPYQGWIPGQVDKTSYGVLLAAENGEEGFDYLTAVEVEDFQRINEDWDKLEVPAQRYAVFPHRDHVSGLRQTLHSIFAQGLPALNLRPKQRTPGIPIVLERYDQSFDLRTGWGDIQVWVPLNR